MTDEAIHELATALSRLAESIDRHAEKSYRKGEKEKSPHTPLKGKDPKESSLSRTCARTREGDAGNHDRLFAEFWDAYPSDCPRKVAKAKCRAKYAKLLKDADDPAALHAAILSGLGHWRKCQDWQSENGKFIKAPLVWLNQENWKDSPSPVSASRSAATSTTALRQDGYRPAIEIG